MHCQRTVFYGEVNASLILLYLINRQSCHHIETSHLICYANQLTSFYMMATLAVNELITRSALSIFLVVWDLFMFRILEFQIQSF